MSKKRNRWNFEEIKEFIMKNCSKPNWAENDEEPILESTIDKVILIAHEIQNYFKRYKIDLERPRFNQCGDGSIDLNFDLFEKGYSILYNYHPDNGESLYGDNQCRNWSNHEEIEIKRFNTLESRRVLGLFARWCKLRNIDWIIEIKQ